MTTPALWDLSIGGLQAPPLGLSFLRGGDGPYLVHHTQGIIVLPVGKSSTALGV